MVHRKMERKSDGEELASDSISKNVNFYSGILMLFHFSCRIDTTTSCCRRNKPLSTWTNKIIKGEKKPKVIHIEQKNR